MASTSRAPCSIPGCGALCIGGRCDKHLRPVWQKPKKGNDYSHLYNDRRWKEERVLFLQQNPCCVDCAKKNIVRLATVVDHIKPHRGDLQLFWDWVNWQGLCKWHHNSKTSKGL